MLSKRYKAVINFKRMAVGGKKLETKTRSFLLFFLLSKIKQKDAVFQPKMSPLVFKISQFMGGTFLQI